MQTDIVCAFQVENNDFIVVNGEVVGYVYSINEDEDYIAFDVVDDEGEHDNVMFGPFEAVTIVASFDVDELNPFDGIDFDPVEG